MDTCARSPIGQVLARRDIFSDLESLLAGCETYAESLRASWEWLSENIHKLHVTEATHCDLLRSLESSIASRHIDECQHHVEVVPITEVNLFARVATICTWTSGSINVVAMSIAYPTSVVSLIVADAILSVVAHRESGDEDKAAARKRAWCPSMVSQRGHSHRGTRHFVRAWSLPREQHSSR